LKSGDGIHPEANIAKTAEIGPGTIIGSCSIGERSIIHSNCVIRDGVEIGDDVIVHPGAVIGADGFGFYRDNNDLFQRFPHLGGVKINNGVEIGANTTIDKGTLGNTEIGTNTKINNLCHIAHNVNIGNNCVINCGVTISGSVIVGDECWIGPGVNIRDGITIGKEALIGMGAAVVNNIADGVTAIGIPARTLK